MAPSELRAESFEVYRAGTRMAEPSMTVAHPCATPTTAKRQSAANGTAARIESLPTHFIWNLLISFKTRAKSHPPASSRTIRHICTIIHLPQTRRSCRVTANHRADKVPCPLSLTAIRTLWILVTCEIHLLKLVEKAHRNCPSGSATMADLHPAGFLHAAMSRQADHDCSGPHVSVPVVPAEPLLFRALESSRP